MVTMRKVSAEDLAPVQTILNNEQLSVTVQPVVSNNQIVWELSYRNEPADNQQKLKFLVSEDDQMVSFEAQKGWTMSEEGFVQTSFNGRSEGKVQFHTSASASKVSLRVQVDIQQQDDTGQIKVETNRLAQDIAGPYQLTLPIAEHSTVESTETTGTESSEYANSEVASTESSEEQTSEEEAIETTSTSEEADSQAMTNPIETTDSTNESLEETEFPMFSKGNVPMVTASEYTDLFEYTTAPIYPVHNTDHYLGSNAISDYIKNFNYGSNAPHQPANNPENAQHYTGVTYVNEGLNFDNGYHEYKLAGHQTGVLTKKTVKPTTDPNTFDIDVDVVGGASEIRTPIDIALVIDRSGSMGSATTVEKPESRPNNRQYYTRFELLRNAVDSFADGLLDGSDNVRIGLASFQSNSGDTSGRPLADISKFGNVGFTNNKTTLMNHAILNGSPQGGTPTFLGVDAGLKLLTEQKYGARSTAKKVLIVLTDGDPTFWPVRSGSTGNYQYTGIDAITINSTNASYDRYLSSLNPQSSQGSNTQYGGNGTASPDIAYG